MATSTSRKEIVGFILPNPRDQIHPTVYSKIKAILAKLSPTTHIALKKFQREFSADWTYWKTRFEIKIAWKAVRRDLKLFASLVADVYETNPHVANVYVWLPQCLCRLRGIDCELRGDKAAWAEDLYYDLLRRTGRTALVYNTIIQWADNFTNHEELFILVSEEYMALSLQLLDMALKPIHRELYPVIAKRGGSNAGEVGEVKGSSSSSNNHSKGC